MYNNYAKKLTKQDLERQGIEIIIDQHGLPHVFRFGEIVDFSLVGIGNYYYLGFLIYELDEHGNKIKCNVTKNHYNYKYKTITLQRAIWAWVYGEIP